MTTPKPKLNITSVLTRFHNLRLERQSHLVSVAEAWRVITDTLTEYFEFDHVEFSPPESASPKIEGGTSDNGHSRIVDRRAAAEDFALRPRPVVRFRRLPHGADLPLPAYETSGAAAMDLRAADNGRRITMDGYSGMIIRAGGSKVIPTGFEVAVPPGYEGQVRPRSGLAAKHGITVLNSPGTIDSDYRGEIKVIVTNHSLNDFTIEHGDRIAQLVIAPVTRAAVEEVTELDQTERGAGGFGSTGVK